MWPNTAWNLLLTTFNVIFIYKQFMFYQVLNAKRFKAWLKKNH